ncbi:MAG: TrkH family potassium uptake protein [Spirochaetales bacterium]|nr:TrkH family potassium uptake protein [Spirochaetales bacterium]
MKNQNRIIVGTLILSVVSLFLEQLDTGLRWIFIVTNILDFLVLFFLVIEIVMEIRSAPYKKHYFRRNFLSLSFAGIFIVLFAYTKYFLFRFQNTEYTGFSSLVLIIRNVFLILKVFSRLKRLSAILEGISVHPAQTILFSFLLVILVGTLFLMMPFSVRQGSGLGFLDALFTSTSAVCVTGLIVVDTATYFSVWGQVVILVLIQIGGLGIMMYSYFTLFVLRKAMSVEDKYLLSYMLSEEDMSGLSKSLVSILVITFLVEMLGALSLSGVFISSMPTGEALFYSVFHAVSAFCNAGFALFSDSLEGFRGSVTVNLTIALLIILGGISFAVILNVRDYVISRLKNLGSGKKRAIKRLTLNSRIVLIGTAVLLLSGTLLFYALEHGGVLRNLPLGRQYLAAFFQSVTLRTAGFNTVPFGSLSTAVCLFMIVYMFIGAAPGGTAGGIKINTVAVMGAYVKAVLKNRQHVRISMYAVPDQRVLKAFLIFLFGIMVVSVGCFILTLTEDAPLVDILFETVSAFGTVGLSTGLTPLLSSMGRVVIILLMFTGRLGPLTILAAASKKTTQVPISFPQADISIG